MKKGFSIWLFFAMCFLVPLSIYAVVNWYEKNKSSLPVLGEKIDGVEHRISDFSMVNQDGRKVTLDNWKGKIVVANFFFTHCPVICPKMTSNLKLVEARYNMDDAIQIASFTVDPERDSSAQLRKYAEKYTINTHRWQLLTGDKKELYKLARKSFLTVATDGDGGPDDFIHSEKLVLIDGRQRIRGYYSGTEKSEVQQLLIDIKKLKNEQ